MKAKIILIKYFVYCMILSETYSLSDRIKYDDGSVDKSSIISINQEQSVSYSLTYDDNNHYYILNLG